MFVSRYFPGNTTRHLIDLGAIRVLFSPHARRARILLSSAVGQDLIMAHVDDVRSEIKLVNKYAIHFACLSRLNHNPNELLIKKTYYTCGPYIRISSSISISFFFFFHRKWASGRWLLELGTSGLLGLHFDTENDTRLLFRYVESSLVFPSLCWYSFGTTWHAIWTNNLNRAASERLINVQRTTRAIEETPWHPDGHNLYHRTLHRGIFYLHNDVMTSVSVLLFDANSVRVWGSLLFNAHLSRWSIAAHHRRSTSLDHPSVPWGCEH